MRLLHHATRYTTLKILAIGSLPTTDVLELVLTIDIRSVNLSRPSRNTVGDVADCSPAEAERQCGEIDFSGI